MSFTDNVFPKDIQDLRQQLLHHPLWQQIEDGTLDRARLRVFALQDWLLVREAYRLDALAIAGVSDLDMQELLIKKLTAKVGGHKLLVRFGEALGLTREDFIVAQPLASCMALSNYFFYMLTVGRPEEKLASVGASEDIFVQICARIAPALMQRYWLNEEQVAFFTIHDEIGELVTPVDETLLARYTAEDEIQRIIRAVRLSHEFELMFFDTVLNTPLY